MKVAIHQPEHLPWPNFFRKMASADLMVLLDHVQYRKDYFQNRNRILRRDRVPTWLTVPVRRFPFDTAIREIMIADDKKWKSRYVNSLRGAYAGTEGMKFVGNELVEIIRSSDDSLATLNLRVIKLLMDKLGIQTPLIKSSTLSVSASKTSLNVEICSKLGAKTYLAGIGSVEDYLDTEMFRSVGIDVEPFRDGLPKYQGERGELGLSVVDLMMTEGAGSRSYFRHLESDVYWSFNARH